MDLDHQSLLADFQHFIDSLTGGSALEICTLDTSNYNCCALKPKFSFISMAVAQMVQVFDSKSVSLTNKNVYNTNITIYQFRNIMFLGVILHDIAQPKLTLSCNKRVKLFDIFTDKLNFSMI